MGFVEFYHFVSNQYANDDKEDDKEVRHDQADLCELIVDCVISEL